MLNQSLPRAAFEVLVIDNGSTDSTRSVAESFADKLGLRYFYDPTPGLHVGRHRGLKEAYGEVLVYADDDIEAAPTWLETIADCFARPEVALVGGNNLPNFEGSPPAWLERLWAMPAYGGRAITSLSVLELPPGRREISPFCVWGCNFSIRKSVLKAAGGFHPDGMPDELIRFRGDGETHVSTYVQSAGLKTLFDSGASVRHAVTKQRMSFEYFRKRAFNQGVSDSFREMREKPARGEESGNALLERIKDGLRWVRKEVRALAKDRELRQLDKTIAAGYEEGFRYHQSVYREDSEVRAWVHKPDYF